MAIRAQGPGYDVTVTQPTTRDEVGSRTATWLRRVGFVVLGLVLGVVLIASRQAVYGIEGGVSDLASVFPLGYAFAAGMVATVNPCGVLLLPSLVAYYLGQSASGSAAIVQRAGRALLLGIMATIGFVILFALVGLIVGVGGRAIGGAFPIGSLIIGSSLAALGVWLILSGREVGILAAGRSLGYVRLRNDLWSMLLFGIGYAVASLACTLPVFLVVVGSALASTGVVGALIQFISYALGMGMVLTVVILAAAFFQTFVQRSVRQIAPYVHRLSAAFLIGAGMFLIDYWATTGQIAG